MRRARILIPLAALLLAGTAPVAFAQPATTSAGPDSVAVTIYRDPGRNPRGELDAEWLEGFALITETRTVSIPAGRAVIRFEGVAGGILPESAILTGLPEGVRERNLDADLVTPYNLFRGSFGRPVTIRRMHGRKGAAIEERGVIRSGPDGAAILQTKDGFEAVRCGGQDSLAFDSVPAGLVAKPTLSIETQSARAGKATVTLSYLAWGFDWQANYIATMRPDGQSADLFAWVTLANGDVTSFANAETMVVAGNLNREDDAQGEPFDGDTLPLEFKCQARAIAPPPPPPAPPPLVMNAPVMEFSAEEMSADDSGEEIIVTGSRIVRQEELGDLKLFRVPERTTVAAMSQKQVAMIDKQSVPVEIIYRTRVNDDDEGDVDIVLRAQNRKEKGLGIPLPAGPVAVFEPRGDQKLLVGEGGIYDKAVGEEVEVEIGEATQVTTEMEWLDGGKNWEEQELVVSNANPWPIRFEAEMVVSEDFKRTRVSEKLGRRRGMDVWMVTVPANGTAKLRYRLKDVPPKREDDDD